MPIEKRAEIAFRVAVEKVIDERALLGLPIYVSRKGKIVKLSVKRGAQIPQDQRKGKEPKSTKADGS